MHKRQKPVDDLERHDIQETIAILVEEREQISAKACCALGEDCLSVIS